MKTSGLGGGAHKVTLDAHESVRVERENGSVAEIGSDGVLCLMCACGEWWLVTECGITCPDCKAVWGCEAG